MDIRLPQVVMAAVVMLILGEIILLPVLPILAAAAAVQIMLATEPQAAKV